MFDDQVSVPLSYGENRCYKEHSVTPLKFPEYQLRENEKLMALDTNYIFQIEIF